MGTTAVDKLYAAEDAQRILQLAIAQEADAGELSQQQLLEIAEELHISPAALAAAESEWQLLKNRAEEHRLFHTQRLQRLRSRAVRYGLICSFLIALDLLTGSGLGFSRLSFSPYIVLFCGLGLSLRAWRTFQTSGERYEKDLARWRRTRHVRQSLDSLVTRFLGPV